MNQTPGSNSVSALNYFNKLSNFLYGDSSVVTPGTVPNTGSVYTMVDESAWDLSTSCGSCHPGGGFVEKDRNGKRFSMMNPAVDGYTPYNTTVFENYDPDTGLPQHQVTLAPWSFPLAMNGQAVKAPGGWGQAMEMTMPDGTKMQIEDGQVMMPNVKEFDCLMCHLQGFSNMMSSVMAYSGAHAMTPSYGAGLMNMNTQAYDFNTGMIQKDQNGVVSFTPAFFSRLKGQPDTQNCRNCHMPTTLKDFPDMFKDFLSSAPMIYNKNFTTSFTGLSMPPYDFGTSGYSIDWTVGPFSVSPTLYMTQTGIGSTLPGYTTMIPAGWPVAMGRTVYNQAAFDSFSSANPGMKQYFVGGGNPAVMGIGPLFFESPRPSGMPDQNAMKKSAVPFARAEWFKRGDVWMPGYDVHLNLDCSGCHMNTRTTKVDVFQSATSASNPNTIFDGKSLCDPGKGYDSAAGVEGNAAKRAVTNSQDTVKKCDNCHVTGRNQQGVAIDTFGARNPTAAHQAAGLLKNVTQAVKTTDGSNEVPFVGNHLDVLDCTVCHVTRDQMVVRELDATSGNRYPNMIGFKKERGMFGMFYDPMGQGAPYGNNFDHWDPLYMWQKNGNYWKTNDDQSVNSNWRRKVYMANIITAGIWNNIDPTVDANGDGVTGAPPMHHAGDYPGAVTANYDAWISRDMKAGMNFGASGFAPIPVGFGGDKYSFAYNPDGSFTGGWTYVGLYGGNILFSTPEEIADYKTWRNQIKGLVDNKSWSGTQLTFIGGPYKVTHGARPVSQFVLGKSCTDCHSATPKAPIFSGLFDMLGTAVKADTPGGSMLMSPAVQWDVVGKKEDIETGAEISTKVGGAIEVRFDELGNWDPATKSFTPAADGLFKHVKPLDRAEALYPIEGTFTDVLGRTYPNRAAWINYITNPTAVSNAANTVAP